MQPLSKTEVDAQPILGMAHPPISAPLGHCTFYVQLHNGALYTLLMISINCSASVGAASVGLSLGTKLG